MEYYKQLALELHFSLLPAPLALSLYRLAKEKNYSSVKQICFAEWQNACQQNYAKKNGLVQMPQTWEKWQASLGKACGLSARCAKDSSQVLIYGTKEFPQQLYRLYRTPFALFARGNLPEWSVFSGFAACGSRKASLQGKRDAFALAYGVCKQSRFRLVSGLTEGIELAACRGALDGMSALQKSSEGIVAVLCCGFDALGTSGISGTSGPSELMAQQILQSGGLLLSEYPPWQPRQSFAFLQRNRILAALAASLIMVELNPKSKAFNLVDYSLELNHDIACVGYSEGVERLRKQGCAHWENGLSLLEALSMRVHATNLNEEAVGIAENMRAELSGLAHEYLGYRFA